MTYDNTKLNAAFAQWIDECCVLTFGGTYSGDLLDSFDNFCAATGMLKHSPGRVAFGRELASSGLEKYKNTGLTYWAGIRLKNPPARSRLRLHAATIARMEKQEKERIAILKRRETRREAQRVKKLADFHARLAAEKRMWERIRKGDYPW